MSIKLKYYLPFLLLLCVSLHACSSRHLVPHHQNLHHNKFETSTKNNEKKSSLEEISLSGPSKMRSLATNYNEVKAKTKKGERRRCSNTSITTTPVPIKSSSVCWKVPRLEEEKAGDKQVAGFNVEEDYSLPQTHPPSHN